MTAEDYRYGKVIRDHRVKLGLTQRQVANQCGITDSALAHIEREIRLPSETVVSRIADALGLSKKVLAELNAGLKAVRERQAQDRVRNRAGAQAAYGPIAGHNDVPDAEELVRDLADDPGLLEGFRYLKLALSKRGQRKTVLRALKAWGSEG